MFCKSVLCYFTYLTGLDARLVYTQIDRYKANDQLHEAKASFKN